MYLAMICGHFHLQCPFCPTLPYCG